MKITLKKTFSTFLIVLAVACSKSKFGSGWSDASVSEKALTDSGCRFVDKQSEDPNSTETVKSLECDEATDEAALAKQTEALNTFISDCDTVLALKNLRPTTHVSVTHLKTLASAKKIEFASRKALALANNGQKVAEDAVEKAGQAILGLYNSKKATLTGQYDVSFSDGVLSYDEELIVCADGDLNSFSKAVSEFIAAAKAVTGATIKSLSDEQRALITKEIQSAEEIISKVEKTN